MNIYQNSSTFSSPFSSLASTPLPKSLQSSKPIWSMALALPLPTLRSTRHWYAHWLLKCHFFLAYEMSQLRTKNSKRLQTSLRICPIWNPRLTPSFLMSSRCISNTPVNEPTAYMGRVLEGDQRSQVWQPSLWTLQIVTSWGVPFTIAFQYRQGTVQEWAEQERVCTCRCVVPQRTKHSWEQALGGRRCRSEMMGLEWQHELEITRQG